MSSVRSSGTANVRPWARHAPINVARLALLYGFAPVVKAIPLFHKGAIHALDDEEPNSPADASLWLYLGIAIALVLAGGVFAGLTIALMGQDEIYLQVIASSGEGSERKNATRVLRLLKRGKHWVLVTLLLSNVITNETLPIVLDRSLGGGWPAVLSSTVLIVIFGEVVPQSICVRYGLPIGAWMAPVVLALMYVMAPVAWPTAKLLDYLLGEDHGTTYKKAGLKTLVTLHKTLGTSPDDRLNEDEVTIISAVLDLKAKPVGNIMTPMDDVFTMSSDTVLDEKMMENILSAGYSRIPIHTPDNPDNFVGMLLVKMLITYDPEDALRVRDFALATLPETRPETSCLDIINFFQEGKSHMVLVSDFPGDSYGAVGVVTLEDVIEELIGEEIIDESDVFVDVHKAIRRIHPAPRTRVPKGEILADPSQKHTEAVKDGELQVEQSENGSGNGKRLSLQETPTTKATTFLLRRKSSGAAGRSLDRATTRGIRSDDPEIRQHLKHLGPSNVASRPKATRIGTVKIKQGVGAGIPNTIPEDRMPRSPVISVRSAHAPQGGVGEGLLESAGREASDGVHSVAVGYGTMAADRMSWKDDHPRQHADDEEAPASPKSHQVNENAEEDRGRSNSNSKQRSQSVSTVASLRRSPSQSRSPPRKRHTARSGSISENIVEANGVRKIVLETTSSSDSETVIAQTDGAQDHKENANTDTEGTPNDSQGASSSKKKNRKKRGKKKKGNAGGSGENQPLLGDHN
ncbi:cell agglutination protein Mam3 [Didymosphaeria variabile]|uniref:Cell agglutination protein Mam3 n=1 Tax=Didymosphaeria variabile TaxID=1932322 RepID=A0A9W8XEX1_9PLEO|nr:cell agglutination protein Mam3 [Didymosphaeria variabile]KAJ4349374.1 cell agglutination protein Mam3 [Didymosphaeria variabile]